MACNHVCALLCLDDRLRGTCADGLIVTAEDIAEEIVWAAARPPHVNIAEVFVLPVNQASPALTFRGGSK